MYSNMRTKTGHHVGGNTSKAIEQRQHNDERCCAYDDANNGDEADEANERESARPQITLSNGQGKVHFLLAAANNCACILTGMAPGTLRVYVPSVCNMRIFTSSERYEESRSRRRFRTRLS